MKSCTNDKCERENPQPFSNYYKQKTNKTDGRASQCKGCTLLRSQRRRRENPAHYKALDKKNSLKFLYDMSMADYNKMLISQNLKCANCKKLDTDSSRLVVDHNHKTGKVRGLLCGPCNAALGLLKDDLDIIFGLAVYLKAHL